MKRTTRVSRRRILLVLAAVTAAAPPRSVSARADASPGQGADDTRRVPDAVRRIIVERLGVREAEVTWEARFVEDLGADSLATVELQLTFEQEFAIDIPDDVAERLVRVGDVVEYLRKREVLR